MSTASTSPAPDALRDVLRIEGIHVHARHGVWDFERVGGQKFVIDCLVEFDSRPAAATDRLEDSIEFADLTRLLVRETTAGAVQLIETLAQRLADAAIAFLKPLGIVHAVEITVHKPDNPLDVTVSDISLAIRREV